MTVQAKYLDTKQNPTPVSWRTLKIGTPFRWACSNDDTCIRIRGRYAIPRDGVSDCVIVLDLDRKDNRCQVVEEPSSTMCHPTSISVVHDVNPDATFKEEDHNASETPSEALSGPQTAAEVLDIIDTFLSIPTHQALEKEQEALWAILTAMRGPDKHESWYLKQKTTACIRSHAFPKTTRGVENDECNTLGDMKPASIFHPVGQWQDSEAEIAGTHFKVHIQMAQDAFETIGRPIC